MKMNASAGWQSHTVWGAITQTAQINVFVVAHNKATQTTSGLIAAVVVGRILTGADGGANR